MLLQSQPRHTPPNPTKIDETTLPDALKGRLSLITVHEKCPGSIPEDLVMQHPDSYQRLIVKCGDNKDIIVQVDFLYYLSEFTFNRDGDIWYLTHTWTRTWGDGAESTSVFINLRTGERHDTILLSWWRGELCFSEDGKSIAITAGIMASSSVQINIIDISNLDDLKLIYYEEHCGEGYVNVSFDVNDIVVCYGMTDDEFRYHYQEDKTFELDYDKQSGEEITKEIVVRLKKGHGHEHGHENRESITPDSQLNRNGLLELYKTKYGTYAYPTVSNVIVVSEEVKILNQDQHDMS